MMDFSVRLAYPVNSNMANHSVDAGDKWHESEAVGPPVLLPQKSEWTSTAPVDVKALSRMTTTKRDRLQIF